MFVPVVEDLRAHLHRTHRMKREMAPWLMFPRLKRPCPSVPSAANSTRTQDERSLERGEPQHAVSPARVWAISVPASDLCVQRYPPWRGT